MHWYAAPLLICSSVPGTNFRHVARIPAACRQDYYKEGPGNREPCLQCPEGTGTKGTGSTRPEQCSVCAPRYSGHPPASPCTKCPVGRWKMEAGDGECTACRAGTTTAGRGAQHAADCSVCTPGFGGAGCARCEVGT